MTTGYACACVCHRIYATGRYCPSCTSDYSNVCGRGQPTSSSVALYHAAQEADEPRRPPARKDKRRWCGGHVGREHVVVIQIPANQPGYVGTCRSVPGWYRRTRLFTTRGRPDWWCFHVHACDVCGKHLRSARADECPDAPDD